MSGAAWSQKEEQRMQALEDLELLDTPPEECFDALARLAAHMLDVPIAAITLIDHSRQWFKSRIGFDTPETPRDIALCSYTIMGDGPFVVDDATLDQRFADNPLVTGDFQLRAYAGIPLRTSDGHAIGALCAVDHEPRSFDPRQLRLLQDVADIVRREILNREAAVRARRLADESLQHATQAESLYRATFDHAAIGIAIVGLDGGWIRINAALCRTLGRSAETLRRMTFQDITHPDDLDVDLGLMRQLLDGESDHYNFEKRYLRGDGAIVWGNLTVALVRDAAGEPVHFVSIVEDITQRRATEDALRQLRFQLEDRVSERTSELQRVNDFLAESVRQRQRSEEMLADKEADLRAVLTHAHDAYICFDASGLVMEWNRQAETIFGWSRQDALGRRIDDLIIPLGQRQARRTDQPGMTPSHFALVLNQRIELNVVRREGRTFPCEISVTELTSRKNGQQFAMFLHDISRRKEHDRRLAAATAQLEAVNHQQTLMLDNELFGIVKTRERQIVWMNKAASQLLGYEPDELVGESARVLYTSDSAFRDAGMRAYGSISSSGRYREQLELVQKSGQRIWTDISGAPLRDGTGESLWMVLDVSVMKTYQEKVEALAYHDNLTGLPNRLLLMDRLSQAISAASRTGHHVAVCFGDLDGFKSVNDRHGHDAGDELLCEVAARLQGAVRAHDTIARLGGDEFVMVLTQLATPDEHEIVIARAIEAISKPFEVAPGIEVSVGASFGVAQVGIDGTDAAELIARADKSMYEAKRQSKLARPLRLACL